MFFVGSMAMMAFGVYSQVILHDDQVMVMALWSVAFLGMGVGITAFWYVLHIESLMVKHGLWQDEMIRNSDTK